MSHGQGDFVSTIDVWRTFLWSRYRHCLLEELYFGHRHPVETWFESGITTTVFVASKMEVSIWENLVQSRQSQTLCNRLWPSFQALELQTEFFYSIFCYSGCLLFHFQVFLVVLGRKTSRVVRSSLRKEVSETSSRRVRGEGFTQIENPLSASSPPITNFLFSCNLCSQDSPTSPRYFYCIFVAVTFLIVVNM